MGVYSGRVGNGLIRAPPHRIIHKDASDNHIGEGVLLACICTTHGGGDNTRDDPDGVLVGSRRVKRAEEINEEEVYLINLTE